MWTRHRAFGFGKKKIVDEHAGNSRELSLQIQILVEMRDGFGAHKSGNQLYGAHLPHHQNALDWDANVRLSSFGIRGSCAAPLGSATSWFREPGRQQLVGFKPCKHAQSFSVIDRLANLPKKQKMINHKISSLCERSVVIYLALRYHRIEGVHVGLLGEISVKFSSILSHETSNNSWFSIIRFWSSGKIFHPGVFVRDLGRRRVQHCF